MYNIYWSVTIAKWIHLFPSRTQKLSTFTPTIVYAKIGSCQFFFAFFFISFIYYINRAISILTGICIIKCTYYKNFKKSVDLADLKCYINVAFEKKPIYINFWQKVNFSLLNWKKIKKGVDLKRRKWYISSAFKGKQRKCSLKTEQNVNFE